MMRFFVMLTAIAVALSVAVAYSAYSFGSINRTEPIASFNRVETNNSPIRAGEVLHVRIWRDKTRGDCPVHSVRTAINQDGQVYDLPDGNWEGGSPDNKYLDYGYNTLTEMTAGTYQLRVDLTYTCPGNLVFKYTQPRAFFRIIE
jgi:hypothetical protein